MKARNNFIYALGVCLALVSCGSDEKTSENSILTVEQMPATNVVQIIDCGRGDEGKAVWVKCKGHSATAKVVINGNVRNTNYYEDHLTASLPQEYIDSIDIPLKIEIANYETNTKSYVFELGRDYKKINNGEVEISVISSGFGGENKSALWITCKGHTIASKIFVGSTPLETSFYEDHLTAAIPQSLQRNILDSVYIKDDATQLRSMAITVQ